MEHVTGWGKLERLVRRGQLGPAELQVYQQYTAELVAGRPVQYVLGESWFGGMKFFVDERVLIPRPETEELVEWVASFEAGPMLDVGTGSGCIAVTLARKCPGSAVFACDVSEGALAVAKRNAGDLGAAVDFFSIDFLNRSQWDALPPVRWLVSNPPYVPSKDRETMAGHVVESEPALALFVPDDDPLVFYRALGEFASERLPANGALFAEIYEYLGVAVQELLLGLGAREVTLRKDMQDRVRMVKAVW